MLNLHLMINKKRLALRSLIASILICAASTIIAYIWTDGGDYLRSMAVWFVAMVSFAGAAILATFIQIIFAKSDKKKAWAISAIIFIALVGLGLWGYSF